MPPPSYLDRYVTAFLVAALGGLTACDFKATVDVDLPSYESQLVVGGFISPGATIEVRFGMSVAAEADASLSTRYLGPGVVAVLYDDTGEVLDTMRYAAPRDGSLYPRYVSSVVPEAERTYELRAEVEGLPPIKASTRIPRPVDLEASSSGNATEAGPRVIATWSDVPGETIYHFSVVGAGGQADGLLIPFRSANPSFRTTYAGLGRPAEVNPEDGGLPGFFGEAVLEDDLFEGSSQESTLFLSPLESDLTSSARLTLSTLSTEFVDYMRALRIQQASIDNPFVLPSDGATNVEGGLGVFAGFASTSERVGI